MIDEADRMWDEVGILVVDCPRCGSTDQTGSNHEQHLASSMLESAGLVCQPVSTCGVREQ